jgi:ribosomal protein L7/L12
MYRTGNFYYDDEHRNISPEEFAAKALRLLAQVAETDRNDAVKAVRAATNMGFKDSKDLVDALLIERCPHCYGVL